MSGINTNKVLFFAYVNMAFLSALTALMCVARFNSAAPTAGASYEMDTIASVPAMSAELLPMGGSVRLPAW